MSLLQEATFERLLPRYERAFGGPPTPAMFAAIVSWTRLSRICASVCALSMMRERERPRRA